MKQEPVFQNSVIGRKLLLLVVLLSSLITLIASAIQLHSNYNKGMKIIENEFFTIEKVQMASLISSVWTSDLEEISRQLDGMIGIPDIQYLAIKEDNKLIQSAGTEQSNNVITKNYPLIFQHRGKQHDIGTLTVQATLNNVYQGLWDQATNIIVSNAIKTFLVGIFLLYVFHMLVTRHLLHMAGFTQQLDLHNLKTQLHLQRKPHPDDELDIVVQGISNMQENLSKSIKQLRENEIRYRQLVESSTAIPWQLNVETWRFTYVGPQAENILGYPVEKWYEENFWQNHLYPDDREEAIRFCMTQTRKANDHVFEYRMIAADGNPVWIRDDVHVILRNNEPAILHGYMFDITQRKSAEIELKRYQNHLQSLVAERTKDLENSNHELEAFCYSVSHDLRSPLRRISGFSQIILDEYIDKLDEQGIDYLRRVVNGCQNMGDIIEALLDLSRVTRRAIEKRPVNLSELCQKSYEQLSDIYSGLSVELVIEPNIIVKGDKESLAILMHNLMDNALKYSSQRKNAKVEFGMIKRNNDSIYFMKDNGVGFDQQYVNKLFQPFQRLHNDNEFKGTGIGLATVQRIVARHGGTVWAESNQDKGATFWFTLNQTTLGERTLDSSQHINKPS